MEKKYLTYIFDLWYLSFILFIILEVLGFEEINIYGLPLVLWSWLIIWPTTLLTCHYYEFKEKKHTSWGLGMVFIQIIFVPLYYFAILRPYWKGKGNSINELNEKFKSKNPFRKLKE